MDPTSQAPTLVDPMQAEAVPAPKRRRRGPAVRILVAVLLAGSLIALSVAVGEWAARIDEMDALVGGITQSEDAMTSTMEDVFQVIGPEGSLAGAQAAQAEEQLRQAAEQGKEKVAAAEQRIAGVPIQPWHHDILAARSAYLAHNHAWQDFLGRAAQDPSLWLGTDQAIESTWEALGPVLTDAVPTPSILDLEERVAAILQDSGGDGGGDGSGGTLDA